MADTGWLDDAPDAHWLDDAPDAVAPPPPPAEPGAEEMIRQAVKRNVAPTVGGAETALRMGSQALAYPAGLLAAFARYMSPWSRPSLLGDKAKDVAPGRVLDDKGNEIPASSLPADMQEWLTKQRGVSQARNDNDVAWKAAGDTRRAVENALTYEPRSDAGKEMSGALDTALGVAGKPLEWIGEKTGSGLAALSRLTGHGAQDQEKMRDIGHEAGMLGTGALAGEVVGAKLRGFRQSASEGLRDAAESAALRATNADRTAMKRVFGRPASKSARSEVGSYLLDSGTPLRSPGAMQDALAEALATEGPEIGNAVKSASASGAKVDLSSAAKTALDSIKDLQSNTETRPIYQRVQNFFDDQVAQHGGQMDPVAAHGLRKAIDNLSKWDRTSSVVDRTAAGAFRDVRGALDGEITKTMDAAGLGDEWAAANANYKNAARAKDLADVGEERRRGNRIGSPSEKAAGMAGGLALALHNPAAGIALPVATVALNRGFFPVTARSANFLSRVVAPSATSALPSAARSSQLLSLLSTASKASPESPLLDELRRRLGLVPAAADEKKE